MAIIREKVQKYVARARQVDGSLSLGKNTAFRKYGKRVLDITGGGIFLILATPVIAAAWLAVRLTSSGAGFFAQERAGVRGRVIRVYKLRSMYQDQADRVDVREIEEHRAKGLLYKREDDPRVTPVGRFIRKTSIDELPQLWNVVRGDMSLVGPRPLMLHMVEPFPEICAVRSLAKPGITGEWQVYARNDNTSLESMIVYDLHYVENHSLKMD